MEGTAPDLVILDLMMPEMDGPTLLGHIREKHGAVPVIVFTGYPDGEAMQRAMEYSPVMFLSKPPRLKQFLDAVRSVIGSPTEA
jgi:two-component system cell cycle sensor histidine kinase/response regulator CckA